MYIGLFQLTTDIFLFQYKKLEATIDITTNVVAFFPDLCRAGSRILKGGRGGGDMGKVNCVYDRERKFMNLIIWRRRGGGSSAP